MIDDFLKEVNDISNSLSLIEHKYLDSYENFEGNDFPEQNNCATEIENSILIMTHEIGTQIAFEKERLTNLLKYIQFRKVFEEYRFISNYR